MTHAPPRDLSHQSTMREWASSQAVCHSFILALLGMVIGSQSTSNRWIGPRPGWLSGAAVYCTCVLTPVCTPLFSEQQHICVTPSPLSHWNFEFSQSSPAPPCSVPRVLWASESRDACFPVNKYSWLRHQIIIKTQLNVIPAEASIQTGAVGASVVGDVGRMGRCGAEGRPLFRFYKNSAVSQRMFPHGDDQNLSRKSPTCIDI